MPFDPGRYPPITNSCCRLSFTFCQSSLCSPGTYRERFRFAITPSSPRPRTASTMVSGEPGKGLESRRPDPSSTADRRGLIGVQLETCRRDPRVHPREILVLPGPDLDAVVVLQDEGSVPVELQLVEPLVALREPLDDLRGHRRDERGSGARC